MADPGDPITATTVQTAPPALTNDWQAWTLLVLLLALGARGVFLWRRRSREPVSPGVFIALVGGVALVAAAFPTDSPWLRGLVVLVGFAFIWAETRSIHADREGFAQAQREQREAAETRFNATMQRHDIATASQEASRAETAKSFADTHKAFAETQTAVAGTAQILLMLQSKMAAGVRHELRRRSWDWILRLEHLTEPYHDSIERGDYARLDGPLSGYLLEYAKLIDGQKDAVIQQWGILERFRDEFIVGVQLLLKEYEGRGADCEAPQNIIREGVDSVDQIDALRHWLNELVLGLPE